MEQLSVRIHNGSGEQSLLLDDDAVSVGRSPDARLRLDDAQVSRDHGRLERRGDAWYYLDLGSRNGSSVNGRALPPEQSVRLRAGDVIRLGGTSVTIECARSGTPEAAAPPPASFAQALVAPSGPAVVTVGRAIDNDIVVDDPRVSSYHLEARLAPGGLLVRDVGSRNGTFLDGERITETSVPVTAQIRLGPAATVRAAELVRRLSGGPMLSWYSRHRREAETLLVGRRLGRVVGKGKTILRDVDLVVRRGQFLAVVGGSGAGKSTLMKLLNGSSRPDNGDLTLAAELQEPTRIGYVPQDEALHRGLLLKDAIVLSAMLRYPPGTAKADVERRADEVLRDLGLAEHARTVVSRLSGGQRKRAATALELMTRPQLLLMDEPTSGLDPATARSLIKLLRKLADSGIGVVLITHSTDDIDLCDTVALLMEGGYLVFYGSPDEARAYFGAETAAQIYSQVVRTPDTAPQDWIAAGERRRRFEESSSQRRLQEDLAQALAELRRQASAPNQAPSRLKLFRWQLKALVARYACTLLGDRRNFLLLLLQAPGILLFARRLFGNAALLVDPQQAEDGKTILFILALVLVWAGTFNAAREICKELPIWERERLLGVRPAAYVCSKVAVLGGLCAVQTLILVGLLRLFWTVPGGATAGVGIFITGLVTALVGVALGLTVSALVPTEDRAVALLPLITIPQMMFSGTLVPLKSMGSFGRALSSAVAARWSFAALGNLTNRVQYLPAGDPVVDQVQPLWLISILALVLLSVLFGALAVWLAGRRPAGFARPRVTGS